MREKIVYILGAGFSAPLGLPVMKTFLSRSKDLYAGDSERFAHFTAVFREISRMAQAKNYLDIDLFNIENILSILDMEDYAAGTAHREVFVRYLADTISALTPKANVRTEFPGNWEDFVFADVDNIRRYCTWLAGLLGVRIRQTSQTGEYVWADQPAPESDFGIISLNYDMVLEHCLDLINKQVVPTGSLRFRSTPQGEGFPLAKIHGSVDPLTIVPPTWQKAADDQVVESWKLAVHLLTEANHIRILGYSYPATDSYVKFLLSLGVMRASHLKSIDVLCLDPNDDVQSRYREFIVFPGFRFVSADLLRYIGSYGDRRDERILENFQGFRSVRFAGINSHHDRFVHRAP